MICKSPLYRAKVFCHTYMCGVCLFIYACFHTYIYKRRVPRTIFWHLATNSPGLYYWTAWVCKTERVQPRIRCSTEPLPSPAQELLGRGAAGLDQGTVVAALVTQQQRRPSSNAIRHPGTAFWHKAAHGTLILTANIWAMLFLNYGGIFFFTVGEHQIK